MEKDKSNIGLFYEEKVEKLEILNKQLQEDKDNAKREIANLISKFEHERLDLSKSYENKISNLMNEFNNMKIEITNLNSENQNIKKESN